MPVPPSFHQRSNRLQISAILLSKILRARVQRLRQMQTSLMFFVGSCINITFTVVVIVDLLGIFVRELHVVHYDSLV
jgi:hypothetical protein